MEKKYRKKCSIKIVPVLVQFQWLLNKSFLCFAIGLWCSSRVKLIPSLNPSNHGICQLVKVRIYLWKLFLDLLGELNVALLYSGAFFWKYNILEEWNNVFLPEYAFVLFPQVNKWVTGLAVIDIWKTGLDS